MALIYSKGDLIEYCDECGKSFTDLEEFAYGHDCEA
jgi:2-hydroxy-3-keto-5-methylthiopentenyl-1-phosphate phosphatase